MLSNFLIKFAWKRDIKSGLYVDYIARMVAKSSILDVFIWASLYVSEKYIIEYCSRFSLNLSKSAFTTNNNPTSILQITLSWVVLVCVVVLI